MSQEESPLDNVEAMLVSYAERLRTLIAKLGEEDEVETKTK